MAKQEKKYSKIFHVSMDDAVRKKIDELEKQVEKLIDETIKAFPFKSGERVAIMDTQSRKFKNFAYFKELEKNMLSSTFYVKYQRESKTGKREKTIITMFTDEFMVPADEVDSNDKYVPFTLDLNTPLKL